MADDVCKAVEESVEQEEQVRAMFNRAWDSLSPEEQEEVREEREDWMGVYAGGSHRPAT